MPTTTTTTSVYKNRDETKIAPTYEELNRALRSALGWAEEQGVALEHVVLHFDIFWDEDEDGNRLEGTETLGVHCGISLETQE